MVVTFASIPVSHAINLTYLVFVLWIVGLLIWAVAIWTAVWALTVFRPSLKETAPRVAIGIAAGGLLLTGSIAAVDLPSRSSIDVGQASQIDTAARKSSYW